MAQTSGTRNTQKSSSAQKSSNTQKTSHTRRTQTAKKNTRDTVDVAIKNEVMLIVIFAVAVFAFLCVIGVINQAAGNAIRNVLFGLFGFLAYLMPVAVFLGFAFSISNKGNTVAVIKMISGVLLFILAGVVAYMIMGQNDMVESGKVIKSLYTTSSDNRAGGGVVFGLLGYGMYKLMGFTGTLFVVVVLIIICIVFITEKSFISGVKKSSAYIYETAHEDALRMKEYRQRRIEEYEDEYEGEYDDDDDEEEYAAPGKTIKVRLPRPEKKEKEVSLRMDKKARGVVPSSSIDLKKDNKVKPVVRQDMHEITLVDDGDTDSKTENIIEDIKLKPFEPQYANINAQPEVNITDEDFNASEFEFEKENIDDNIIENNFESEDDLINSMPEPVTEHSSPKPSVTFTKEVMNENVSPANNSDMHEIRFDEDEMDQEEIEQEAKNIEQQTPKKYIFPPIDLLKKGEGTKGDSSNQLKETALRLQQTLANFGVKVTITDISQGPSVTRYEMQPEQGVKVSKIVGLADDIKLNLAATDIRIEAPIPGKAAVGIEVPNKENSTVALRDLIDTNEFNNFKSNLAFAVGKDIGGQVVVADIAKMPHVLIAGATGSGKSVCINTIIMSILYKADPSDVKLIMIDPKVVELSVYNGIPHLMIPVVTDPKKASAALNWGVTEMNDRYSKFAELNVRDLKGYNNAAAQGKLDADGQPIKKLPQIVIIVDELADLMMVASNEVEESICRLAQLARACGIHLVIATQRPSVDVITGLIKANMPSRIAFSVSSGVDSRTILDMNGAEKLLGKGDMLFYPQGYPKPARVQGAFVSDSEVSDVVDFLKNEMLGNISYDSEIESKIKTIQSSGGSNGSSSNGSSNGSDYDAYFVDAGKFVIDKDKASIGMLQRVFKIGFNRAARIVDQLEEAGVVGAEEGTKPRRILMSFEEFQNFIEENL